MNHPMQIEAREAGSPIYYTGKPCRHGHSSPRYVSNQICVECARATRRRMWAEHGDRFRQEARARYPDESERRKAASNAHYRNNKATVIPRTVAYNREWRRNNPDLRRAQQQRAAKANPQLRVSLEARRRARKRGALGRGITSKQWSQILAESLGICAYCNERKPLTMDHIEPLALRGEHDIDNAAAVCGSCNYSKHKMPLILWLARRISHQHR